VIVLAFGNFVISIGTTFWLVFIDSPYVPSHFFAMDDVCFCVKIGFLLLLCLLFVGFSLPFGRALVSCRELETNNVSTTSSQLIGADVDLCKDPLLRLLDLGTTVVASWFVC
jgi:hypothetical protein